MIRGLYTAAAGMITQQNRQDILTNNMANVVTPGYKANQAMVRAFPEMLIQAMRLNGNSQQLGPLNQGVFVEESVPVFVQGDLMETGVLSHMALWDADMPIDPDTGIKPSLFFTVIDENGNRYYTRSGLFNVDAAGQLVTPEGHMLLNDDDEPILVNGRAYIIDEKGNITFSDGETTRVGVTLVNNPNEFISEGNQLYSYQGNDNLDYVDEEANYKLFQGKIERSNVDVTQTMVDMMTALKIYEANQKVVQSIDRTLEKAVNEVGRV